MTDRAQRERRALAAYAAAQELEYPLSDEREEPEPYDHRSDRSRPELDTRNRELLREEGQRNVGRRCYVVMGGAGFYACILHARVRDGTLQYKVAPAVGYGTAWIAEPRVLLTAPEHG